MINYVKYMKIKMTEINVFVILFMKNDCDNNLFLNCF